MNSECKETCPSLVLEDGEVSELLGSLKSWQLNQGEPKSISKEFKFKNFLEAYNFVDQIVEIAELMNHHPNIEFTWGYVKITYWTHNASGLTEMDFQAAQKIDQIPTK
jgi:4a-hydroxytetrahydrobiopterin dehydratase